VYWATTPDTGGFGAIHEADLNGNNAHIIAPGESTPAGVAADASHIYWADESTGTINEADLNGNNAQIIVRGQASPVGVAVNPP